MDGILEAFEKVAKNADNLAYPLGRQVQQKRLIFCSNTLDSRLQRSARKRGEGVCLSNQEHKDLIEYHQGSWTQLAKDPESWLRKAEALKNAADAVRAALWPKKRKHNDTKAAVADFFQGPVYMLLAGLAVETLIKGIIVGADPDCVVQGNRLTREFATHDLQKLYRNAGLRENTQLNDLLLRLQHYVETFGRYPVTRSKNEMDRMLETRFASDPDFAKVERVWALLVNKIQAYISAGD